MPGCMIFSQKHALSEDLCQKMYLSINCAQHLPVKECRHENFFSALSHVSSCVLQSSRFFDDGTTQAWFAGLLPDAVSVPWPAILHALQSKSFEVFASFCGPFAIAVHHRTSGDSFFISDRCSQYPAFYSLQDSTTIFSTSYRTFFDCLSTKQFDEKWLTDFLLFNFPLEQNTPIKNVFRMPAASVLTVSKQGQSHLQEYAPIYRADIPPCTEKECEERTHALFSRRIPLYYQTVDGQKYAAAVTSGFDARTNLAYRPAQVQPQLYTYGIQGSSDIEEGRRIARSLELEHHYLSIDEPVLQQLFSLVKQNAEFSGGTNPAMRSALVFVYDFLAKHGIHGVITGISADHFFRSTGATPHTLSESIVALARNPAHDASSHAYFSLLQNKKAAEEHLAQSREFLEQRYQWSKIPTSERLLTFNHYELAPKYFGGELALAENYVSMVSPYWDTEIRKLSYTTNLSTLTITPLIYKKFPYWKQHQLFSSLLVRHPQLKQIPVHYIPPAWYAKGSKAHFTMAKVLYRAPKKIYKKLFGIQEAPLEDWSQWLGKYTLPKLTSNPKELLLAQYIHPHILEEVIHNELSPNTRGSKMHLGGKILTAELILQKF